MIKPCAKKWNPEFRREELQGILAQKRDKKQIKDCTSEHELWVLANGLLGSFKLVGVPKVFGALTGVNEEIELDFSLKWKWISRKVKFGISTFSTLTWWHWRIASKWKTKIEGCEIDVLCFCWLWGRHMESGKVASGKWQVATASGRLRATWPDLPLVSSSMTALSHFCLFIL